MGQQFFFLFLKSITYFVYPYLRVVQINFLLLCDLTVYSILCKNVWRLHKAQAAVIQYISYIVNTVTTISESTKRKLFKKWITLSTG